MIRVTNKSAFDAKVAAWIAAVKIGAAKAVVKIMQDAQMEAVLKSPVYSGDYASNWNVSYGQPDTTFNATADYFGPEYPSARNSAWGMGAFNMTGFALGQTAFLTNAAEHDEPYAWLIEEGKINFRPVNVGKDRVLGKTLEHLAHTYKTIPRSMLV